MILEATNRMMWEVGDIVGEGLAMQDRELYWHILQGGQPPQGYDVSALYERVETWERLVIIGKLRCTPVRYHKPSGTVSELWYFGRLFFNIWDSHRRQMRDAYRRGLLATLWMPYRAIWAYVALAALAIQHVLHRSIFIASALRYITAYTRINLMSAPLPLWSSGQTIQP